MVDADIPQRARGSRGPWLLVALLLGLAAAWSAAWLFVSSRATAAMDAWLQAENRAGRQWTCPARHVGGYPFAVKLRCDRPTYHGEVAGRTADGIVEGVLAEVRLDHPQRLLLRLRGPLNLRSEAEDFDLAVSWDQLGITVADIASSRPHGGIDAVRLAITLETARQGDERRGGPGRRRVR
jgi:hypothetical protein